MAIGSGTYHFYDYDVPDARVIYYRVIKPNKDGKLAYSPVASINSFELSFNLYPNPFNGTAYLTSNDNENYNVELVNSLGQVVELHTLKSSEELEIGSGVSAGVYMVRIYNDNGFMETLKLVKSE